MTEASLPLARAGTGADEREQAIAAIFHEQHTPLVRLAALLGADDPEDIVAEAFYQLFRRWRRLRDPDSAVPYLRSVVCNLTRMRIRHLQVARRHVARSKTDPTTPGAAADDGCLREDQRELLDALIELPARQREALVLRYWLDLREAEIAKAMGISAGAVKSHTSRGTAALTHILQRRQEESGERASGSDVGARADPPGGVDQYIGPQATPVPVSVARRAEGR